MAKPKEIAGFLLLLLAMVITITALVIPKWVIWLDSGSVAGTSPYTWTSELDMGVKKFQYIYETTRNGVVNTQTVDGLLADQAVTGTYILKEYATKLDDGGTYAIASGSVALGSAAAAIVLVSLTMSGKPSKFKGIAAFLALLSGALVVFGVVTYSRKLDVGYSFILAIAASFFIFAASISLGSGLVGKPPSKLQQSVGLFLFIGAIIIMIVAMSTLAWWQRVESVTTSSGTGTYTTSFGLKTWSRLAQFGSTTTETTGSLSDSSGQTASTKIFFDRLDKGGTNVIITGTLCLVGTLISFILCFLYVCVGPRPGRYQFIGVVLGMLSGGTNILGIMLYADTLRVGVSFLLFVAAGFFYFAAMATLIASFAGSTDGHDTTAYKPQKDIVPSAISPGGPAVEGDEV